MTDQKLVESFKMMWDSFPTMVRLIQKDRTVLAVNKAAEKGGCTVGFKCFDGSDKDKHKGCKANLALKERQGVYQVFPEMSLVCFWIPVEGYEDVYVHFAVPSVATDQAVAV
jgi:hypothetical protein